MLLLRFTWNCLGVRTVQLVLVEGGVLGAPLFKQETLLVALVVAATVFVVREHCIFFGTALAFGAATQSSGTDQAEECQAEYYEHCKWNKKNVF